MKEERLPPVETLEITGEVRANQGKNVLRQKE